MGKKRGPNIIMTFLTAVIAISAVLVCISPYLPLKEGSLPYAVLNPVHDLFDRYVNVFADASLREYGLIPVTALCLVNFILALMGSGLIQFLLRCTAFYGAYLVGTYFQGRNPIFEIQLQLPDFYPYVAAAYVVVSLLLLFLIHRVKKGSEPKAAAVAQDQPSQEFVGEDIHDTMVVRDEAETSQEPEEDASEVPAQEIPRVREPSDPILSRKAMESLVSVHAPEYQSFPNYTSGSTISSVDRGIYDVAEREARIRKEEQMRREAELERRRKQAEEEERARKEEEEARQRLQNMFKPRNLMKRLNEDAMAEKSFPTFSTDMPSIDFGMPESTPEEEEQISEPQPKAEPAIQFTNLHAKVQTPMSDIPVSQQIPISQMSSSFYTQEEVSQPGSVFKEAAAQAEMDEQLESRRRQAEYERKHLEEMRELERQRREAEEAARRAEEELAQAKAEMQRRLEEEKAKEKAKEEAKRAAAEAEAEALRLAQAAKAKEEAEEEEGISDADMAANDAKSSAKGPDVDYVSGVAGTKSSRGDRSHLLDKKKFDYKFPSESILKHYPISAKIYEDPENDPDGQIIVETFRQFRIETSLIGVQHGPTFTLYELNLAKGIKVTSVLSLSENIAMELSVEDVRILAPIPGKPAIGVEVPNKKRDTIGFDVMMPALKAKFYKIPMVLGKTITGESVVIDVAKTPHLLVAGTTGSGKSVCINGLICSVLFTKTPRDVRMILVDPKMVELSLYNGIPHLLTPVITDAKKALKAMNFVVEEMERRMAMFSSIGAKKIEEYNEKIVEKKLAREKLPYIMVIIDEFADLMLAVGKELETSIKRITAVARFCGIHLILATQRPSADVITGVIKSNIPTQIAFAVSNSMNSRIIIDQVGAEKLLGRGDMLYNNPESRQPSRIQGAFIDSEIEEIVSFVKTQGEPDYIDESYFEDDDEEEAEDPEASASSASEDLFSRAWKIVSDRGEASASYLQRRLNIGYNRAANLIEQMEDAGYVGPARGSKPREILKLYGSD